MSPLILPGRFVIAPFIAVRFTFPFVFASTVPAWMSPFVAVSEISLPASDTTFEALILPPAVTVIEPFPAWTFASVMSFDSVTVIAPVPFVATKVATAVSSVMLLAAYAVNTSAVIFPPCPLQYPRHFRPASTSLSLRR